MGDSYTVKGISIPNPANKITVAGKSLSALSNVTKETAVGAIQAGAQRIGQTVVNQAVGRATSFVNGKINEGIEKALSFLPTSISQALYGSQHEDFNRLRQINKQLVHTDFVQDWNFRLEIDGAPTDMDFYVKDISISAADVGTDEEKYGAGAVAWPTSENLLHLSMTLREDIDGRIGSFFGNWLSQIMPGKGNVGLPLGVAGYVRTITLYNIDVTGAEMPYLTWDGYPTQIGDISRSRENGNFMELPVTITQFSSLGHKNFGLF